MTEPKRIRSLGVEREGKMFFFEYDDAPLREGEFKDETLYTGFSAGTELTFFKGTNPYLHSSWDADFGLFREGEPGAKFPVNFLGYMETGRVVESRTPVIRVGETVAMTYGHKTEHIANPLHEFFVPVPEDIDPILGIYVAQMGPICANGLLHAAADSVGQNVSDLGEGVRGRNVLITGAGVIGLITGLFALHHGAANVAVADSTPERLAAARALGLTSIDENETEVLRYCKERWHAGADDRGADIVFQCRGQAASLQTALQSLRPQGTVIDLAFYQGGLPEVRLGEEFHHNGLKIMCAQIGRVPRGLAHLWNRRRLALETIELLRAKGKLIREHLITDVVPFDDAPDLIADLSARRRHVLQAVFEVAR